MLVLATMALGPRRQRFPFAILILLLLVGIAANRSLTALAVLASGAFVIALDRFGWRKSLAGLVLGTMIAAGSLLAVKRGRELVDAVRAGSVDALLSYRTGAWGAAAMMIEERPYFGFGPGSFGAEFAGHRIEADIRHRRRLVNPAFEGAFTEAHSDYLQEAAETGLPATLLICAAIAILTARTWRARSRLSAGYDRFDAICVTAILVSGAVAALTWFPMYRPATALLLVLAAGRAWRLVGDAAERSA